MNELDNLLDELQDLTTSEARRALVASSLASKQLYSESADVSDLARKDREAIARVRGQILALFACEQQDPKEVDAFDAKKLEDYLS